MFLFVRWEAPSCKNRYFLPNKIKRIHLFKDGEPFLNPDIIKMIKYAKKSEAVQEVDVTTNASLIDSNMADQIVLSGLVTRCVVCCL